MMSYFNPTRMSGVVRIYTRGVDSKGLGIQGPRQGMWGRTMSPEAETFLFWMRALNFDVLGQRMCNLYSRNMLRPKAAIHQRSPKYATDENPNNDDVPLLETVQLQ